MKKVFLKQVLFFLLISPGVAGCAGSPEIKAPPVSDSSPEPFEAVVIASEEYSIHAGDLLEISVFGEPDLSRTVRVGEDGKFSYPLLKKVQAARLHPRELEFKLIEMLKEYLVNPQVTIFIKEYGRISILGQVKRPGTYELKGKLTVTQAISLAGGFTKLAYRNGTKVIRMEQGKPLVFQVKVREIIENGKKSLDIYLIPGDLVTVPESFF